MNVIYYCEDGLYAMGIARAWFQSTQSQLQNNSTFSIIMVCKHTIYDIIISRIKDKLHPHDDDCVMHMAPSYKLLVVFIVDDIPVIYYMGFTSLILGRLMPKLTICILYWIIFQFAYYLSRNLNYLFSVFCTKYMKMFVEKVIEYLSEIYLWG